MSALTARRALDDGVQPLERNVHARGGLDLGHAKRFEELLQEHLARMGRGRWVGSIGPSSVIVGAPHVECVCAFEAEHDSVLVVDPHRVEPAKVDVARDVAGERLNHRIAL